jgi:hypothetical protein
MPLAARLSDCTVHLATPLAPGTGSLTVKIGFLPAWRALPAGVGDGIEKASAAAAELMKKPQVKPPEIAKLLEDIKAGLSQSSNAAAEHGNPAAAGVTAGANAGLDAANKALTAAYTTAAAAPGGEPAASIAYAKGIQTAVAAAAAASIAATAAMTDMHICPVPTPIPHGPGVVTRGSKTVFIDKRPAARQFDKVFEAAGGSAPIAMGMPTVNIG